MMQKIANSDDIANLKILPYGLFFQKSLYLLNLSSLFMIIYVIGC